MKMEDNLTRQVDEVEALSSIYSGLWNVEDEANRVYSMKVEEGSNEVVLFVTLPLEYPSACPPIYQLSAPWLKGPERQDMCGQLEEVYLENVGEPVLFQWIEKLRCILQKKCEQFNNDASNLAASISLCEVRTAESEDCHVEIPLITHGDIITDRKSVFQGHVASVVAVDQVRLVLSQLYENKKIANATHNIYAYRIYNGDTKTFLQDCEDDGETHAGGRLLHLLQILDVKDVMVVVSRWYGGILLGPDRFRHINNAARQVLECTGYVKQAEGASAGGRQMKKKR